MASSSELGTIHRSLVLEHPDLASRAVIVPNQDLRLVKVKIAAGIDKFCELQGIEDARSLAGTERFYLFQRWGDIGGRAMSKLRGPMTASKAEASIRQAFRDLTGFECGVVDEGHTPKDGMFWLKQSAEEEDAPTWEYFVADGVDGKTPGWYPYAAGASSELEGLYAQHVAGGCPERTAEATIKSGFSTYVVNLSTMVQMNRKTETPRQLRRLFPSMARPSKTVSVPLGKLAMKHVAGAAAVPDCSAVAGTAARLASVRTALRSKVVVKMSSPSRRSGRSGTRKKRSCLEEGAVLKGKESTAPVDKIVKKDKLVCYKVLAGRRLKAAKDNIEKNRWGRWVAKGRAARSQKHPWILACREARKTLGISGFCVCGGKSAQGQAVYKKARALYEAMK
eukprot:TRINITY_DN74525_c0_g1_i1.p1 TRINITY_DN74525_c0_g1~~TRINITY_DN74525_c0_g1_i1.p1  ORF type:complete len:394 (-),score=61.51 TRINITY_DN74525_c0_g1_i1:386-1567(-)